MEKKLKKRAIRGTVGRAIFLSVIIDIFICILELYIVNESLFNYLVVLKNFVMLVLTIRKIIFIKQTHLTYGKVIKTAEPIISNDVVQDVYIEYLEENSNSKCEISVSVNENLGDYSDDEEIQEFLKKVQNLIGKKVPLLYEENKPKRTIVFLDKVE